MKNYKQFITERNLMKDVVRTDSSVDLINKKLYEKRYINQLLMLDVVREEKLFESIEEDIINKISTGDWKTTPEEFLESVNSSKRLEFLTPYSIDELSKFEFYKLEGYKIGFAIKEGDIILVHNNEEIGGIGKILIRKAIQFGGYKLDHFDGFLTGFYRSLDFKFKTNDYFLDEYAPKNWKYTPMDINDKTKSIYVDELVVKEPVFNKAEIRYKGGMPDVVYREL